VFLVLSPEDQSVLQEIVRRRMRSLIQYVSDSVPWPNSDSEAAEAEFQKLAGEEQAAVAPIFQLLACEGKAPYIGSYASNFTSINFVTMAYILPLLLSEQPKAIAQLERDEIKLSDPKAREPLQRLLSVMRRHRDRLEAMKIEFVHPVAAAG
jgi:hypothetical protein